jgi:hypothetical protein
LNYGDDDHLGLVQASSSGGSIAGWLCMYVVQLASGCFGITLPAAVLLVNESA